MSPLPEVAGRCPACGTASLYLGSGGYVTCARIDCPRPDAAATLLDDAETEHIVVFDADGFTIRHPLRERLDDALMDCQLHHHLAALDGPPVQPGRYRALPRLFGRYQWERLPTDQEGQS